VIPIMLELPVMLTISRAFVPFGPPLADRLLVGPPLAG